MAELIDHKTKGIVRLGIQYRESTNLINYVRSILKQSDELEQVFQDLLTKRSIDTAEGVQLDIIGDIVGQSRQLIDAETFAYFGFLDHPQSKSFGSTGSPDGGNLIYSGQIIQGFRTLTDIEYALFIKARILKNNTKSTVQDIIDNVKFVINVDLVVISEGIANYTIQIGKELSLNEKALIKDEGLIPKTAGCGVSYVEFNGDKFFSFLGSLGGEGFDTGEMGSVF